MATEVAEKPYETARQILTTLELFENNYANEEKAYFYYQQLASIASLANLASGSELPRSLGHRILYAISKAMAEELPEK